MAQFTKRYEVVSGIIIALPDNADEVSVLLVASLFNDNEIFYMDSSGKWRFEPKEFIAKHPTIKDQEYYLNEIQTITAIKTITDDCKGYYSGCGCAICEIRDERGDKRRRVR
jgi:hypothetical protein